MARTRVFGGVLLVLALALAACGGGGDGDGDKAADGADRTTTTAAGGATTDPAPSGDGKVDCAAVKEASQQLLGLQLLAQIRTPDSVASMKAGTIGKLDLDAMEAALTELEVLGSYSSPLGDPAAAIASYQAAVAEAQELFAADPVTQAAIDTYNEHIGTVSEFLGHQAPIAGALDAAGC